MKVTDLSKCNGVSAGVIAFGFFDCIHLGHRHVISSAVSLARRLGVASSVYLFRNNIYPLIGVNKSPVFTFEERLSFIAELGVDQVFYADADAAYLSMTPNAFLKDLQSRLEICGFTCGKDFTFGAKGEGTPEDLIRVLGGVYEVLDLDRIEGQKISSEGVKRALFYGNIDEANRLLGRRFSLIRIVQKGRKDGEKIGFPTVNCELGSAPLKEGVYFTDVLFEGNRHPAVTNVGTHPTFGDYSVNTESYLLDYRGDLYGKKLKIEFLRYHREIVRFSAVSELIARIEADVKSRREYD